MIAFNRPLDQAAAEAIVGQQFAEVIVAPEIGKGALAALAKKPEHSRARGRLAGAFASNAELDLKTIDGGLLLQGRDTGRVGSRGREGRHQARADRRRSFATCSSHGPS